MMLHRSRTYLKNRRRPIENYLKQDAILRSMQAAVDTYWMAAKVQ